MSLTPDNSKRKRTGKTARFSRSSNDSNSRSQNSLNSNSPEEFSFQPHQDSPRLSNLFNEERSARDRDLNRNLGPSTPFSISELIDKPTEQALGRGPGNNSAGLPCRSPHTPLRTGSARQHAGAPDNAQGPKTLPKPSRPFMKTTDSFRLKQREAISRQASTTKLKPELMEHVAKSSRDVDKTKQGKKEYENYSTSSSGKELLEELVTALSLPSERRSSIDNGPQPRLTVDGNAELGTRFGEYEEQAGTSEVTPELGQISEDKLDPPVPEVEREGDTSDASPMPLATPPYREKGPDTDQKTDVEIELHEAYPFPAVQESPKLGIRGLPPPQANQLAPEVRALQSSVSTSESTKQSLQERVAELEKRLDILTKEKLALQQKITASTISKEITDMSFEMVTANHDELQKQHAETQKHHDSLLGEMEELKEIKDKIEVELAEQKEQRKIAEFTIKKYSAENEQLLSAIANYMRKLEDPTATKADKDNFDGKIATMQQAYNSNIFKIDEYNSILASSKDLPDELVSIYAHVKTLLDTLWTTYLQAKAQNDILTAALAKKEQELQTLRLQDTLARAAQASKGKDSDSDSDYNSDSEPDSFQLMYNEASRKLRRLETENRRLHSIALSLDRGADLAQQNKDIRAKYTSLSDRYARAKSVHDRWKAEAKAWLAENAALQARCEAHCAGYESHIQSLEVEKSRWAEEYQAHLPENNPDWYRISALHRSMRSLRSDHATQIESRREERKQLQYLYTQWEERRGGYFTRTPEGRRVQRYESEKETLERMAKIKRFRTNKKLEGAKQEAYLQERAQQEAYLKERVKQEAYLPEDELSDLGVIL